MNIHLREKVSFLAANIVNHHADGLISTGNVHLNMSGGVNGELRHQGGANIQKQLHGWLATQEKHLCRPALLWKSIQSLLILDASSTLLP